MRVFVDANVSAMPFIHPVVIDDLWECRAILARHGDIRPRDAIHAAVMHRIGVRTIVSYDRHFDSIAGIDRVTPDAVL